MKRLCPILTMSLLCFIVTTSAEVPVPAGEAECADAADEVYVYYIDRGYSMDDAITKASEYFDSCVEHNPE